MLPQAPAAEEADLADPLLLCIVGFEFDFFDDDFPAFLNFKIP